MSAHTAIAWQNARNILCVRVDNLGDVLMTTPAIRALKTASPHRRITLLTSQSGAEVARFIPDIDATIQYDAPWVKHGTPPNAARDLAMRETLADGAFDAAVIFTVYSQNPLPAAMLCHLAGIPLRLAHCRENPYQLLTDWVAESDPGDRARHEGRSAGCHHQGGAQEKCSASWISSQRSARASAIRACDSKCRRLRTRA